MVIDGNSSVAHVKDEPTTTAEKKDELNNAVAHYKTQKMQFQLAEARLMKAFDSLLEVPVADGHQLSTLLEGGGKPTLIVFYAPWCPHCQTFVLHDGKVTQLRLHLNKCAGISRQAAILKRWMCSVLMSQSMERRSRLISRWKASPQSTSSTMRARLSTMLKIRMTSVC